MLHACVQCILTDPACDSFPRTDLVIFEATADTTSDTLTVPESCYQREWDDQHTHTHTHTHTFEILYRAIIGLSPITISCDCGEGPPLIIISYPPTLPASHR